MSNRHQRGITNAGIGTKIEDPNIDYASLARSLGLYGEGPITNPNDLGPALRRAVERVERGETALVDVQERTELDPKLIEGGLAVKDTVGEDAGGGHESDERADTEFENMESPTELVAFTL